MEIYLTIVAAMVLACLALLAYCAHKIRRVHLQTFAILDRTVRESDTLFAQLQALMALERRLDLAQPLPATRGWVGSPDFLLMLADHIADHKPRVVLECSSGVSTLVLARSLQQAGAGHVFSLEHAGEYAEKTRALLQAHGLSSWATVIDAPLAAASGATPWYDISRLPAEVQAVELLAVDGPPGYSVTQARYPALPMLLPRLAPRCTILLDDADRPDERAIVQRWLQAYPEFQHRHLAYDKGLAVLTRGVDASK